MTDALIPPVVDYPKGLCFWNKNIAKNERLELVNAGDFPIEEILKSLGIADHSFRKSFGITNIKEIRSRQELVRFLLKEDGFREFLGTVQWQLRSFKELPRETSKFHYQFQDGKSAYWKLISTIERTLKPFVGKKDTPEKFNILHDFFLKSRTLADFEDIFVKDMNGFLGTVTHVEGYVDFRKDPKGRDLELAMCSGGPNPLIWGYKHFAVPIEKIRESLQVPQWIEDSRSLEQLHVTTVIEKLFEIAETLLIRRAMKPAVIRSIPKEIMDRLQDTLQCAINEIGFGSSDIIFRLHFEYSKDGLKARVENVLDDTPYEAYHSDFDYYPRAIRKQIKKTNKWWKQKVALYS
ncbi:MAG: hypothetical protein AAB870_03585, partial [Patescibacteria group bacterium]